MLEHHHLLASLAINDLPIVPLLSAVFIYQFEGSGDSETHETRKLCQIFLRAKREV